MDPSDEPIDCAQMRRSWEKRLLVELEQGPLVYAYPGFMGAVCERLVDQGLVTREPWGEQFRYSLAPRGPGPIPIIDGGFSVILADPPWEFKAYSDKGLGKSPQRHYDCLPTEEICAFPVKAAAAKHCALFMWCIWPMIFDAEKVAKAWGFTYSGLAWEWIKRNPETGKYAFGGGYGTRKNVEPCLLFRRGSPTVLDRSVRDFLFAKRREHSQKPLEQYERIERMYTGPYLELFARPERRRRGWSYWGNEVDKFAEPRRASDATGCG